MMIQEKVFMTHRWSEIKKKTQVKAQPKTGIMQQQID